MILMVEVYVAERDSRISLPSPRADLAFFDSGPSRHYSHTGLVVASALFADDLDPRLKSEGYRLGASCSAVRFVYVSPRPRISRVVDPISSLDFPRPQRVTARSACFGMCDVLGTLRDLGLAVDDVLQIYDLVRPKRAVA